MQKAQALSFSL